MESYNILHIPALFRSELLQVCRWSDCLHPGLYIWIICILHWYHIFLTILPKVSVVSFHKL